MPTTEAAQRDYTTAETQAYERYISAVEDHEIIKGRADATIREKMDFALAIDDAFRDFCRIAGMEMGNVRSLADLDLIKAQKAEIGELTEAVRSAYSMLFGIQSIGAFQYRPADADMTQAHMACCTLLDDATTVMAAAMKKADGI